MATLKKLYDVIVTNITELSPSIKGYSMVVNETTPVATPFKFKAGQWLDVHVPGASSVGGYSLTCSPNQFDELHHMTLAIQYSTHPVTNWLHTKCSVGTKLQVEVGGDFFYDPAPSLPSDLLLIAGGIGINPLYSILQHQCHLLSMMMATPTTPPPSTTLLYSARNEKELIFKDDIEQLTKVMNNFTYNLFTTKEHSLHEDIKYGRITVQDIQESIKLLPVDHTHCYICGPPPFINDMITNLQALRVNREHIHYEQWCQLVLIVEEIIKLYQELKS